MLFQIKQVEILLTAISLETFTFSFKKDMERGEAEQLVRQAIRAGIFNDLGSGSNVDICVITKVSERCSSLVYWLNVQSSRVIKFYAAASFSTFRYAGQSRLSSPLRRGEHERRSPGQLPLQEGHHRRFEGDRQTNSLRSCLGNGRRHGHFVILFRGDLYPTLIHVYVIHSTDFGLNFKI